MNLAWRDVSHQKPRFLATAVGLGLLFAVVLAMGGIYRGMVEDAVVLVDAMNADLWIVQRQTRGPFAERSVIPRSLEIRAEGVPGVASARPFTTTTIEPMHRGRPLRMTLVGLDYPDHHVDPARLVAGRLIERAHREVVVDATLGLSLGETVRLGDDDYLVVGITRGLLGSGGDGLAFVTSADLGAVEAFRVPEAVRLAREAGLAASRPGVSALLVDVRPGVPVASVRDRIARWTDVSVHDSAEQRDFLLLGVVDKARRQIGLFRALLAIVSGIVVSLVIFNMTVAKTREIALLKLMGARTSLVSGMILQQSLLLTALAYSVALFLAQVAFPHFPRRVVVGAQEYLGVLGLSVVIALVASIAAIRRALAIPPTSILAG